MQKNEQRVLIVEDSDEMLWSLANVLESAGYCVDAVTTGAEAVENLNSNPHIRLVILNYLLPDMSGVSVLRKIREHGCDAEVIGLSAFGKSDVRDGFLKAGAFCFLEKPFDIRELVALCAQALSRGDEISSSVFLPDPTVERR